MKKALSVILALMLVFGLVCVSFAASSPDFADEDVLVVVKREYNMKKDTFSVEDFPEVELREVNMVMPYWSGDKGPNEVNAAKNCSILHLVLKYPGKENVLAAIEALQYSPYVKSAEPNWCCETAVDEIDLCIDPFGALLGDVNNDGKVNSVDVTWLLIKLSGGNRLINEVSADVYRDGQINLKDVSLLMKMLAGYTA